MKPAPPAGRPCLNRFSKTLPIAIASVEDGRAALVSYLEPLALGADVLNRIEVVLEELISNVVRHSGHASHVALTAHSGGDGVVLCVEDDGEAFNPLEAEAPKPFDSLADARLGGLGIPLIKKLSHSVVYERVGSLNRMQAIISVQRRRAAERGDGR